MDFEQAAILLLLVSMLVLFALGRIRMEVVALSGLGTGLALGLVTPAQAFSGFSSPAFITVVEILLVVQVLGRSGILDPLARRIPHIAQSEIGILAALCAVTALISVFMNNIGALALMIPIVASVCRASGIAQRRILMPVSFAALLGSTCSVIGTPASLVVSHQLAAATGAGFAFFDFAWVGFPTMIAGLLALLVWPRRVLAPEAAGSKRLPPQSFRTVVSEIEVRAGSSLIGKSVAEIDGTEYGARERACSFNDPVRDWRLAMSCYWRSTCRVSRHGLRMGKWNWRRSAAVPRARNASRP